MINVEQINETNIIKIQINFLLKSFINSNHNTKWIFPPSLICWCVGIYSLSRLCWRCCYPYWLLFWSSSYGIDPQSNHPSIYSVSCRSQIEGCCRRLQHHPGRLGCTWGAPCLAENLHRWRSSSCLSRSCRKWRWRSILCFAEIWNLSFHHWLALSVLKWIDQVLVCWIIFALSYLFVNISFWILIFNLLMGFLYRCPEL